MIAGTLLQRLAWQVRPPRARAPLPLDRIESFAKYRAFLGRTRETRQARRAIESRLAALSSPFTLAGWCYVCRAGVRLSVGRSAWYAKGGSLVPNWRESLVCPVCGLNNRMRAAVQILEEACDAGGAGTVYITEQTTPLYRVVRARYPATTGSEYLGARVGLGCVDENGVRNESIAALTFHSDTFDRILCFDVLEHVPEYLKGFAECFRCLKPGGSLLFSVPFTADADTLVRARLNPDGTIEHLLPPEYHGDPLNTSGCLCFYHFGWDLLDGLREVGFDSVAALAYWSREFGYLGEGQQLTFLAQKPRHGRNRQVASN